jgi:hypothetical protein
MVLGGRKCDSRGKQASPAQIQTLFIAHPPPDHAGLRLRQSLYIAICCSAAYLCYRLCHLSPQSAFISRARRGTVLMEKRVWVSIPVK